MLDSLASLTVLKLTFGVKTQYDSICLSFDSEINTFALNYAISSSPYQFSNHQLEALKILFMLGKTKLRNVCVNARKKGKGDC